MGLVNLKDPDTGWTGHSNLGATDISGDLGGLALVKDSGGSGGSITGVLSIGGSITGRVAVPGALEAD